MWRSTPTDALHPFFSPSIPLGSRTRCRTRETLWATPAPEGGGGLFNFGQLPQHMTQALSLQRVLVYVRAHYI